MLPIAIEKSSNNESLCSKEPSQSADKFKSESFLCIAKKDTTVTDLIREDYKMWNNLRYANISDKMRS